ncbi:MAG: hypothetical protein ACE37H_15095 [Phycisphaeraceae bacterium]
MTRVLHLLDEQPGLSSAMAMRLSADAARWDGDADDRHAWLLIGGESMRDAAASAGVHPDRVRLMPRPDRVRKLVPGAMRKIKALMSRADRVECWTVGAAALASGLGCETAVPRFGQAALCGYAGRVIAECVKHATAVSEGAEGVGPRQSSDRTRDAIRRSWGVEDGTFIVALLADHPARVDAREAFMATAFAFETLAAARAERGDVRLLCHPNALGRNDACELAELLRQPQLVLQDARALAPWSVLTGCDIAVAPDPIDAGLSILWADALGLAVIAPPEPRLELLGGLEHVQPCQSGSAKHLAHRLTRWAFDRQPAAVPSV